MLIPIREEGGVLKVKENRENLIVPKSRRKQDRRKPVV
jgi:hypothetical protein